jgi:hypothetical protein
MVIDTNPADAPFGKAIGLRRQRVEVGPVELFEERPAGDTEAPDRAFVVELTQQLADRRIEFGQTVEATVAQAAEQPSLDNQHRDFDPRFREGRLLVLSGTSSLGTPPSAAKARVWAPILSASAWVQLAWA